MDPTSTTLGQRGKFIPSRPAAQHGPHDGAMISPYAPERQPTQGEIDAWAAIARAALLAARLKHELAAAMAADNRADTALQDAFSWITAMLDAELPGARRALDEEVGE